MNPNMGRGMMMPPRGNWGGMNRQPQQQSDAGAGGGDASFGLGASSAPPDGGNAMGMQQSPTAIGSQVPATATNQGLMNPGQMSGYQQQGGSAPGGWGQNPMRGQGMGWGGGQGMGMGQGQDPRMAMMPRQQMQGSPYGQQMPGNGFQMGGGPPAGPQQMLMQRLRMQNMQPAQPQMPMQQGAAAPMTNTGSPMSAPNNGLAVAPAGGYQTIPRLANNLDPM